MKDDGTMARVPDLIEFCREHGMKMLTVAELIRYRLQNERYIKRAGESRIQTRHGEFRMIAYQSEVDGGESHLALVYGALCCHEGNCSTCGKSVLVRVHTRCTAGDVFGADCGCREVLDESMRMIAEAGCGAIVYLHNTSRGFELESIGGQCRLLHHRELRAQEQPDERQRRIIRSVGLGGQILSDLGIHRIRLISNTPMHIPALEGFGLEILEQVPAKVG
jgi:3,4-dihydroxy 2-butanone 4-phosphate synthase / GTP cyclohydrolase II